MHQAEEERPLAEQAGETAQIVDGEVWKASAEQLDGLREGHGVDVGGAAVVGEITAVAGGYEEGRGGIEITERQQVEWRPDVVNHHEHPLTGEKVAQEAAGGVEGLEGRRLAAAPETEQIAHARQTVAVGEPVAEGQPEDAVRICGPDPRVVAERLGQRGLAEAAGTAEGGGDPHRACNSIGGDREQVINDGLIFAPHYENGRPGGEAAVGRQQDLAGNGCGVWRVQDARGTGLGFTHARLAGQMPQEILIAVLPIEKVAVVAAQGS